MAGGPGDVTGDEAERVKHVGAEYTEVVGSAALVALTHAVHVAERPDLSRLYELSHASGPRPVAVLVGHGDLGAGGFGGSEHGIGFVETGRDGLLDVDALGARLDDVEQPASVVLEVVWANGDQVG